MIISLLANYIVAVLDNGNDPPAPTINLESSDEKHAITKLIASGLKLMRWGGGM